MHSDDRPGKPAAAGRGTTAARELSSGAERPVRAGILAAVADLERLLQLLDQAGGDLMDRFSGFDQLLGEISRDAAQTPLARHAEAVRAELLGATTAMQFQDMSTQLVEHALSELRTLAQRLGDEPGPQGRSEAPHVRRSPVSQSGIGAGSIDLF